MHLLALSVALLACSTDPAATPEICNDGVDNDGDGTIDCLDDDCAIGCFEDDCSNGVDDDGNGKTDCYDPACFSAVCAEICDDRGDNDLDGATDCDDSDCAADCVEVCDDGIDNDGDGLSDCADPDCGPPLCEDTDPDTDTDPYGDPDTATTPTPTDTGGFTVDSNDTGIPHDGTYFGIITVEVLQGALIVDTCVGPVTIVVDEAASPQVQSYGNVAACTQTPYGTADITGDITQDPAVNGVINVAAGALGTATDTWGGGFQGDDIVGTFSGTLAFFDYRGDFSATR